MHVLVTGGAGYIGGVTAAALLDAGHTVTVVDDLRSGYRDAVPEAAHFVRGDVTDGAVLDEILGRGDVEACLHFAALIEAGESMRSPERFFAVNTAGAATVLGHLVAHGVERFVFSSTAAVYGDPAELPLTEDAPLRPTNAYGESKLLVERMLPWLAEARGLRWAALRYFNAAGATAERGERHDPETHLIPLVLDAATGAREDIALFGTDYPTRDGTAVRDYIHVADLADAHVAALDALDHQAQIVCNLGNGHGFSVREVVAAAEEVTGRDIPAREAPRREGDPAELVASAERAREVLGWSPRHTDLHDIIASAWQWRQARTSA